MKNQIFNIILEEFNNFIYNLLEFIDISHSPKNILIRASKANLSKDKKEKSLNQVEKLMNEFNFNPTLCHTFFRYIKFIFKLNIILTIIIKCPIIDNKLSKKLNIKETKQTCKQ